jgi:hypothetical protein
MTLGENFPGAPIRRSPSFYLIFSCRKQPNLTVFTLSQVWAFRSGSRTGLGIHWSSSGGTYLRAEPFFDTLSIKPFLNKSTNALPQHVNQACSPTSTIPTLAASTHYGKS